MAGIGFGLYKARFICVGPSNQPLRRLIAHYRKMATKEKATKGKKESGNPSNHSIIIFANQSFSLHVATKEKRTPSPYNLFMKTEIERLKKADPTQTAKDRFKTAALNV